MQSRFESLKVEYGPNAPASLPQSLKLLTIHFWFHHHRDENKRDLHAVQSLAPSTKLPSSALDNDVNKLMGNRRAKKISQNE